MSREPQGRVAAGPAGSQGAFGGARRGPRGRVPRQSVQPGSPPPVLRRARPRERTLSGRTPAPALRPPPALRAPRPPTSATLRPPRARSRPRRCGLPGLAARAPLPQPGPGAGPPPAGTGGRSGQSTAAPGVDVTGGGATPLAPPRTERAAAASRGAPRSPPRGPPPAAARPRGPAARPRRPAAGQLSRGADTRQSLPGLPLAQRPRTGPLVQRPGPPDVLGVVSHSGVSRGRGPAHAGSPRHAARVRPER